MATDTKKVATPPLQNQAYGSDVIIGGKVVGKATYDVFTGLPRVAPGSTPPAPSGDGVPIGGKIANPQPGQPGYVAPVQDNSTAGKPFAEVEKSAYEKLLGESGTYLDSINAKYKDEKINQEKINTDALAEVRGSAAAGGMGGSGEASTARQNQMGYNEQQIRAIEDKRTTEIGSAMETIRTNSETMASNEYQYDTALRTQAKADANDFIKNMATTHQDWSQFKTSSPQEYQHLVDLLGGANAVDAAFANSIPKPNILNTMINGSGATVISQDPVTGKVSASSYDLGIAIPKTWTMEKIGTNAVIYHDPTWNPTDPKTYQIFAIDPLTGLPTKQIGGDQNADVTKEKSTVGDLSSAIAKVESGGSYTAVGPMLKEGLYKGEQALGKYQIVPGAWFDKLGLDPTSEQDKQNFLADASKQEEAFGTIMGGLIRQYGDTGKAVAAYFGGDKGAKAYGTPEGDKITDGNQSINQYVGNVLAGVTKSDATLAPEAVRGANQDILAKNPSVSNQVKAIAEGRQQAPRTYGGKVSPLLNLVNQFDPTFDANRYAFRTDFEKGNMASNITLGNTGMKHLSMFIKEANGLSRDDLGVFTSKYNSFQNFLDDSKVDPKFRKLQQDLFAASSEMAGFYAAGAGHASPDESDKVDVRKGLALDGTVSDIQNLAKNAISLMYEKTGTIADRWTSTMNSAPPMDKIILPDTQKALAGIGYSNNPEITNAQTGASGTLDNGTAVTKADDGKWYDATGKVYDDNGNPI